MTNLTIGIHKPDNRVITSNTRSFVPIIRPQLGLWRGKVVGQPSQGAIRFPVKASLASGFAPWARGIVSTGPIAPPDRATRSPFAQT